jgi:hypothetical protein
MISVLSLKFEAFRLSLTLDLSSGQSDLPPQLVYVSSLKFTDGPGACRLSFERVLDAIISRSSERIVTQRLTLFFFSRLHWLYWSNL